MTGFAIDKSFFDVYLRKDKSIGDKQMPEFEVVFPMAQKNGTSYPLPWHKSGTRAAPESLITLPEPLPQEFGVGIWFKPYHTEHEPYRKIVELNRETYSPSNRYRIFVRAAPNSRQLNFVQVSEGDLVNAVSSDVITAGVVIGVYCHFKGTSFIPYYRIGDGSIVQMSEVTGTAPVEDITKIHLGHLDGENHANAILSTFALHTGDDIDAEKYLSNIPGVSG